MERKEEAKKRVLLVRKEGDLDQLDEKLKENEVVSVERFAGRKVGDREGKTAGDIGGQCVRELSVYRRR